MTLLRSYVNLIVLYFFKRKISFIHCTFGVFDFSFMHVASSCYTIYCYNVFFLVYHYGVNVLSKSGRGKHFTLYTWPFNYYVSQSDSGSNKKYISNNLNKKISFFLSFFSLIYIDEFYNQVMD